MNYQIIKDEEVLKKFIDWLPELKETERYYLCLFARNKYCKELTHIKSDKAQLKRFVSDKDRMFQKIKQLEVEEGWYKQKDLSVPQEALALYITPNPREMWKASINSLVKLANCVRDHNILVNPHQEVMSEIQRTKSRTCYIDFDIDFDKERTAEVISYVKNCVNEEAITWLNTRGGLHVLIAPEKVSEQYRKTFYQNIVALAHIDQVGDNMIPVPGTSQGNYIPHFTNY